MSAFGYRINELRNLLAQLPAPANDRINQSFTECIDRYCELRQSALDDLVDYFAKASAGNLGTQSKWQSRISRLRSDHNNLFAGAARDLMLPPGHQLFWANALQAEERFFDALSSVNTPQLLDTLLQHQDGLSKLIGALQDTWTFLLSKNQGIQNDEMRALQQIDEMVQKTISDLDTAARAAFDNAVRAYEAMKRKAAELKQAIIDALGRAAAPVEALWELLKKLITDQIKPDGMPDDAEEPMKETLKQMELMVTALGERVRIYRQLLASYQELVNLEKGSVLTMFNKTREDINRYLSENDVSKARVWLDQAKGQLNDWVSGLPTTCQRDDGTLFREDIFKYLDNTWEITLDLNSKFRSQFQGAFLSPISNETVETLAQLYQFRQQLDRIKDRDAADKLADIRAQLPERVGKVEESLSAMDEPINALPSEIQDFARSRNKDFKDFVHERIKRQIELLLPAIDELKKVLTPSNLDSDFNRQELESMLR